MTLAESSAGFRDGIDRYAAGKLWYWHIPLWLFGLYAFVEMFSFDMVGGSMPGVLLVPYSFDFVLHEFAHLLTGFLPSILTASAGSVSELLLGAGLAWGAFHFRNYFASLFCLLWFDLTLQSAGTYMADAVPERLPLVSLGGALSGQDPVHDWHFVFGHLHMLGVSEFIGNTLRALGHLVGLFGVMFAAYVMYRMAAVAAARKSSIPPAALSSWGLPSTGTGMQPKSPSTDHADKGPISHSLYPTPTRGSLADYPQNRKDDQD